MANRRANRNRGTGGAPQGQQQLTYEELLQRVEELTNHVTQQNALGSRLLKRPPNFNGTTEDIASRDVETWLRLMEDYLAASGENIETSNGVRTVASYLGTDPRRVYDSHVQSNGRFVENEEGFKRWLIQRYSPADPLHTYRDAFEQCRQRSDEPFDAFHSRFLKAHSLLDHAYEPPDLTYKFVSHLDEGVVGEIRKDMSSYENVSTQDILGKLKRMYPNGKPPPRRSSSQLTTESRPADFQTALGKRISDGGDKDRYSGSRKRQKTPFNARSEQTKHHSLTKNSTSNSENRPLTENEKEWLTKNVKRGGGKYIFDNIQKHSEWRQIADKIRACYQCGAVGHDQRKCLVRPPKRTESLHSIIDLQSIPSLFEPGALDHLNSTFNSLNSKM
jgi:hypothetical protein